MNLRQKIYKKLNQVPKGKVITYKELAKAVNSRAYRYVGTCMANNNDPKLFPCYKVIRSDGQIGNYSAYGGIKKKIELLRRDRIKVVKGRIDLEIYGYKF
jgi:methylated-DNA-[protein]-cysteine S-methyltransferase